MQDTKLFGPFKQIITLRNLPAKGSIPDDALEIIPDGGILIKNGLIEAVGSFNSLRKEGHTVHEIETSCVALPGLVDAHTHICFGGSRARDYSLRISGKTYQEILKEGGGIYDSVEKTRSCSADELLTLTLQRLDRHHAEGITTCEIKSGYGLSVEEELKLLRVIDQARKQHTITVISTCLAAHVPAKERKDAADYLQYITRELLPIIKRESLSNRVDIFIEPEAFPVTIAEPYIQQAKAMGFDITIHADQFTSGGSELAVKYNALSADHLESSAEEDIKRLASSNVVATVLPGASLGLGMNFAPARKLLNAGCSVAIATDWNPGSAPMGDLLMQAAVLSAREKLSTAETLAGITVRAAKALNLHDRGVLDKGMKADIISFPASDYREILYQQGKLKPTKV